MSLFCPVVKCKEQKGPCDCEKIMAAVVSVVAFIGMYHHLITVP